MAKVKILSQSTENEQTAKTVPMFTEQVAAGFPSPADDYLEGNLDLNKYLIQHPVNQNKNIHISWDSSNPIFDAFNPEGFTFDCAMHSEQWGEGISFGRSMTRTVSDTGQVQTIIRNVINFPAPVSLQGE